MDHIPIYKVTLVCERVQSTAFPVITSPADVYGILMRYIGPADREHFVLLLMDTRHRVCGLHTVSIGSLNSSIVHPREVFKMAILANSAAIILAHNHPSGDATPSEEDLAITRRLQQAGELLGIPVLDHLIVSPTTFVSLKERGII